jgi:hypothetical protein
LLAPKNLYIIQNFPNMESLFFMALSLFKLQFPRREINPIEFTCPQVIWVHCLF